MISYQKWENKKEKIMKTLLIAALLSVSTVVFGQTKAFYEAVEKQDLKSISNLLADEIEVCIKDDQSFMSKSEAKSTIKAFLKKVGPKSVSPLHSGSSGAGSKYKVAKMSTNDGEYRIFVYMEDNKIQEVRFDTL